MFGLLLSYLIFFINYVLLGDSGRLPDLLKQVSLPIVDQVACQEEVRKEYGESYVLVSNKNNQQQCFSTFLVHGTLKDFKKLVAPLPDGKIESVAAPFVEKQY
jgi:hypothetical protein